MIKQLEVHLTHGIVCMWDENNYILKCLNVKHVIKIGEQIKNANINQIAFQDT